MDIKEKILLLHTTDDKKIYDDTTNEISIYYSEYCNKIGMPRFIGIYCVSCKNNIFERWNGEEFITGCTSCCYSYCE